MGLRAVLGSLPVAIAAFVSSFGATAAQIALASPSLDWPRDPAWLTTAPNPWLLLTAILAGLSAWAAIVQLMTPKAATPSDLRREGARTRIGVSHVSMQLGAEGRAAEHRHRALMAAIQASGIEFAIGEIRAGRLGNQDRERLVAALSLQLEKGAGIAAQVAQSFAKTAADLAFSPDARDRRIVDTLVGGDPEGAADQLMLEVSPQNSALSAGVMGLAIVPIMGSLFREAMVISQWTGRLKTRALQAAAIYAVGNEEKHRQALAVGEGMNALRSLLKSATAARAPAPESPEPDNRPG